jgi:uncharacterized protein YhhL (DUF1145 family)
MKANIGVYYAAATTTIITGLLQLVLSSTITALEKGNPSLQIFFIGIGVLQLFWAVGIIRKWGSPFYSLATGLNVALIFLWVLLRLPQTLVGAALPIDSLSIAIEALQIIFFALCIIIMATSATREFKTNIMDSVPIAGKLTSMASRRVVLGIGAVILIIGIAGIAYTMQQVVQQYGIKKTSTPPYTSEPPVQTPSSVYIEIGFVIIFIAGLTIISYGATLPSRLPRQQIGR